MKKNLLILAAIFMIAHHPVSAQSEMGDSSCGKKLPILRTFTMGGGYAYMDVSALNLFISPASMTRFDQNFGVLSLQSTNQCHRFIFGYTLQAGMTRKTLVTDYAGIAGNNTELYASFGNVLMHTGYAIVNKERIKFYPVIGGGFGGTNATFTRVDNQSITQFSSNPGITGTATKYMICFDAALSLDFMMPGRCFRKTETTPNYGRVLSIRVGYTQGLGIGNWRFDGGRILENPTYNPGILYAKLGVGLYKKRGCN